MWAIGEVTLPLGAMEVVIVNPLFYISKYCVGMVDHIAIHHQQYYTNPHFKIEFLHCHHTERRTSPLYTTLLPSQKKNMKMP